MITNAILYACIHHKGQKRKDGTPYIYHPLQVAETLKDAGYDEVHQTVAILHDLLEDTNASYDEISMKFGKTVADAVAALTREEDEAAYVEKVRSNDIATIVKIADKIHNLEDAVYLDKKTAKNYIEKAEKYYEGKLSPDLDSVIFKAMECVDYDTKMKELRRREKFRLYDKIIDISFPEDYDYFRLDCSIFRIKNFDAVVASFDNVDMECLGVTRWVPCKMCLLDYYDDIKRISVEEAKKEAEKR